MMSVRPLFIPHDSVNDEEVKIVARPFSDGAWVSKGQIVLEYETSKAVIEIVSDVDAYITYRCEVDNIVRVGSVVAGTLEEWDAELAANWRSNAGNGIKEVEPPKKLPEVSNAEIGTQYSHRANTMIEQFGLSRSLFSGMDFVSVEDVRRVLQERTIAIGVEDFPKAEVAPPSISCRENSSSRRLVVVCANDISNEMILDILSGQDKLTIVGYVADDEYKATCPKPVLDSNVFDFPERINRSAYDAVILAMGGSLRSMQFRRKVFEHYKKYNIPFANLISPTANIANNVVFGVGNIVESNVYIGPGARIGDNNFISYSTTIGHHNLIGNNNLFAPGVMMAGLVRIGDDCILPTGVNFIDKVSIGDRVILPVGYDVVSNIPDDSVVKIRC